MSKEIIVKATWEKTNFDGLIGQLDTVIDRLAKIAAKSAGSPITGGGAGTTAGAAAASGGAAGGKESIEDLADAYSKLATTIASSLKSGSDALNEYLKKSSGDIEKFILVMDRLKGSFAGLPTGMPAGWAPGPTGTGKSGTGPGPGVAPGRGVLFDAYNRPIPGTGTPSGTTAGGGDDQPVGGGTAPGSVKGRDGKFMATMRQLGGSMLGSAIGYAVGGGPVGQAIGGAIGSLPILARAMPYVGLAYAAGSLVVSGMQAAYADETSKLEYNKESPFWAQRRKAEVMGQGYSQVLAMRAGDVGLGRDIAQANTPEQVEKIAAFQRANIELIRRDIPQDVFSAMLKPGEFGRVAKEKAGAFLNQKTFLGAVNEGSRARLGLPIGGADQQKNQELGDATARRLSTRMNENITAGFQLQQRLIGEFGAMNVIDNQRMNTIYQGAQSSFDIARQIGKPGNIGTRWVRSVPFHLQSGTPTEKDWFGKGLGRPDPRPGWELQGYDDIADHEMAALKTGHSSAALRAEMQRMRQTSGRLGSEPGAGALLDAQAAGLYNATDLKGLGDQVGNRKLYKHTQDMLGRTATALGGVAGAGMIDIMSAHMRHPNYTGSGPGAGEGFAQMIADSSRTGDPATDMWRIQRMKQGLPNFQAVMAGKTDKLQEAIAVTSINRIAGNEPLITQDQLLNLPVAVMYDILKKGPGRMKMPANLVHGGTTLEMIQARADALPGETGSRILDQSIFNRPGLQKTLAEWRKGAGGVNYSLAYLKLGAIDPATGVARTPKSRSDELDKITTLLETLGYNAADRETMVRAWSANAGVYERSQGSGVSNRVNMRGLRGESLMQEIKIRAHEANQMGLKGRAFKAHITAHFAQTQLHEARTLIAAEVAASTKSTGAPADAAEEVAAVMKKFARVMRAATPGEPEQAGPI